MNENNIPKHWQIKKLAEVCTYSKGKKPLVLKETSTTDCSVPYINIKAFEKGIISEYTNGEKCNICNDDDLLMVWDGARCGLIGKAKKGAVGSTLMKILPKENIDKEYLYHFISSKYWTLNTKPKGVGIPHIEPTLLWNFELVVPPLPEQQAIVAKIEELFSELENGKQQLLTAQQQLKVYRQSLLKWAFEGKLTNHNVKEGELPEGWKWVKNKELLKYVTSGSRDWKQYYSNKGSRFIRTQDINSNKLDLSNSAFMDLPEKVEGKRSLIEEGDILMTITGANVGKVAVVDFPIEDAYVSQSVALLKYQDNRITKFLWYFFQTQGFGKSFIDKLVYGVGRPVLSLENMREVDVISCPIEDQQKIINEIESKLTVCDKVEETIAECLQQTETLKQSILKKAFEGKLI